MQESSIYVTAVLPIFGSIFLSLSTRFFESPGPFVSTAVYSAISIAYGHISLKGGRKKEARTSPRVASSGYLSPSSLLIAFLYVLGIAIPGVVSSVQADTRAYLQARLIAIPALLLLRAFVIRNPPGKMLLGSMLLTGFGGFAYFLGGPPSVAGSMVMAYLLALFSAMVFLSKFILISKQLGFHEHASGSAPESGSTSPDVLLQKLSPAIFVFSLTAGIISRDIFIPTPLSEVADSFGFYTIGLAVLVLRSFVWFYMVQYSFQVVQKIGPSFAVFFSQIPQLLIFSFLELNQWSVAGLISSTVALVLYLRNPPVSEGLKSGLPTFAATTAKK